jgi:diguanylate cyclase (GGDEF)-like protein
MALLIITVTAYIFTKKEKYTVHVMFGVYIFLVCFFLPFAFADSGGSKNNAIGYTFLLLIVITYLFIGWRRIFLIAALIIAFMIMHAIEYFCPELITNYSEWNQFLDRMIQIPLLLAVSFFIVVTFAKEYEKLNYKLEKYASFDELTGLYNRRMFNKAMADAVTSGNTQIYLVLFDVDNFKKLNDNYGHNVGDEALVKLSNLLKEKMDLNKHIVSRWGGDEFAIIYYGDELELRSILEEIDKSFKDFVSAYEKSTGISMSLVSFGDYNDVSDIIIAADRQLYNEKMKKH